MRDLQGDQKSQDKTLKKKKVFLGMQDKIAGQADLGTWGRSLKMA